MYDHSCNVRLQVAGYQHVDKWMQSCPRLSVFDRGSLDMLVYKKARLQFRAPAYSLKAHIGNGSYGAQDIYIA